MPLPSSFFTAGKVEELAVHEKIYIPLRILEVLLRNPSFPVFFPFLSVY